MNKTWKKAESDHVLREPWVCLEHKVDGIGGRKVLDS